MGFSLIMPFLPLYLEDLGVHGPGVGMWSGVIYSSNFIVMAIVAPIWGAMSDRVGRKPMMLRSAFGMGAVVWLMGIATSPWQLLIFRMLQGLTAGFMPATTAYMASAAPREKSGYALGLLATGNVTGAILGPLAGGALAKVMGYRPIFFMTTASCLIAGLGVLFLIREQYTPQIPQKGDGGFRQDLKLIRVYPVAGAMIIVLFMNMFSMLTAEPIISLYLQSLKAPAQWLELLSGLVFSMTGLATLLVSPVVGRLSDSIGSKRLLVGCLSGAAVMYIVQGFATATWQMVFMRFGLGIFTGGLMPAANGLIARNTPRQVHGRIFGLTTAAIALGNTAGPLVGGAISSTWGLRAVFPVTGLLLILDIFLVQRSVRESAAVPT
jgi:MFS family permease